MRNLIATSEACDLPILQYTGAEVEIQQILESVQLLCNIIICTTPRYICFFLMETLKYYCYGKYFPFIIWMLLSIFILCLFVAANTQTPCFSLFYLNQFHSTNNSNSEAARTMTDRIM